MERKEKGQWRKFSTGPHLSFVLMPTGQNLDLASLPVLPPSQAPFQGSLTEPNLPCQLPALKDDSPIPSACILRADARGHLFRFQEIMHSLWRKLTPQSKL